MTRLNNKRGFSVTELLVVQGIVGAVMAFFMPMMEKAHDQTRTLLCQSQINDIGRWMSQYEQDNQRFPYAFLDDETSLAITPPGRFLGDASYDRVGWWWQQFLCQYSNVETFHQPNPFDCPGRQVGEKLADNPLWGNYGVNQSICRTLQDYPDRRHLTGHPLATDQLTHVDQTLLITDSGYNILNWSNVTTRPAYELSDRSEDTAYLPGLSINASKLIQEQLIQDALQGRHEQGCVNAGFCDGHVETVEAESLLVIYNDETSAYHNLDVWTGGLTQ